MIQTVQCGKRWRWRWVRGDQALQMGWPGSEEKDLAIARSRKQRWEVLDVEMGVGEWVKAAIRWVEGER